MNIKAGGNGLYEEILSSFELMCTGFLTTSATFQGYCNKWMSCFVFLFLASIHSFDSHSIRLQNSLIRGIFHFPHPFSSIRILSIWSIQPLRSTPTWWSIALVTTIQSVWISYFKKNPNLSSQSNQIRSLATRVVGLAFNYRRLFVHSWCTKSIIFPIFSFCQLWKKFPQSWFMPYNRKL